jgi:hypothetical protein
MRGGKRPARDSGNGPVTRARSAGADGGVKQGDQMIRINRDAARAGMTDSEAGGGAPSAPPPVIG